MSNPELAIDVRGLVKVYGRRGSYHRALDGLDLQVPYGGVHAFLGPNGSGKTTTIRVLLGLVRRDEGTVSLLGRPQPEQLPQVIGQVGAIVESPKFFGAFTARQTLRLLAEATSAPERRVDECLDQVGLLDRAGSPVKGFSLGMRQRLAIATTLLKDPRLFIFDEPTNGLDPEGIHEVRETIRGLGAAGRTVLLSSHLLAEVQQVAERVTVVARGRSLRTGTLADLVGTDHGVLVETVEPRAAEVLAQAGFAVRRVDGRRLLATGPGATPRTVNQALTSHDVWPDALSPDRPDLERAYLALTSTGAPR